mmetsp:Transcript_25023/g.75426  ORF Transcript_25023/g.75426 Transcript_25023/m.75426 type:complete len:135 (+) Transcript_25023:125-529(+)
MGCSKILVVSMHFLMALSFIAVLTPQIFWAKVGSDKISLWQNCSSPTGDSGDVSCGKFGISENDAHNEHKALLDGCRASCVLGAIFAIVTAAVSICDRKFGAVFTAFLVGKKKRSPLPFEEIYDPVLGRGAPRR